MYSFSHIGGLDTASLTTPWLGTNSKGHRPVGNDSTRVLQDREITSLPRRQYHVASLLVTAVLERAHSGDQGFLGLQRFKKTETRSLEMRNEGHFTSLVSQEHIINNHPYLLKFSPFTSPPHEIIRGHYIPCRSFHFRSFFFSFYFPSFKRTAVSTFSLVCAFL